MKHFLLVALWVTYCTVAIAQNLILLNQESVAYAEVASYVDDWTKNLAPRYRQRAVRHVYSVAHWSIHYSVDPLLVAVCVSLESSWRVNAIGHVGEIGLMQIHPGNKSALKDIDVSTGDGQIQAGTRWLAECIDLCGDTKRGLNAYATGSCSQEWRGLNYRWRLYQRAVKRFRVAQ